MKRLIVGSLFLIYILLAMLLLRRVDAVYGEEAKQAGAVAPGEVIVRYKEGKNPRDLLEQVTLRSEREHTALGKIINRLEEFRLEANGDKVPEQALSEIRRIERELEIINQRRIFADYFVAQTREKKRPALLMAGLGSLDEVIEVEPNYLYRLQAVPDDPLYSLLWNMQQIGMESAWDQSTGSRAIGVAVVDSGIDETHQDLVGQVVEARSFVNCSSPGDLIGHGTHVSGTVGAVGNNAIGTVGVNWRVGIMSLRVGCTGEDITAAAVAEAVNYAYTNGARVINLSIGGAQASSAIAEAIFNATQAGVVTVASVGNCGDVAPGESTDNCPHGPDADQYYPASDPNAVTVSATGPRKERAHYSSYGSVVDLAAPGGNPPGDHTTCSETGSDCIISTWPGDKYVVLAGTSMAAPHVSGTFALMLAKNPSLGRMQLIDIVQNTAEDLGSSGKDDEFGYGLINAGRALAAVPDPSNTPIPTNTPSSTPEPTLTLQPTATPTSVPTNTPQPSPTITPSQAPLPTNTPLPTLPPGSNCPAECPAGVPPRSSGNSNCDGVINLADYTLWREQWGIYAGGGQVADGSQRTADFDCAKEIPSSIGVSLADFEFWRRGSFGFPTATPGSLTLTTTPRQTPVALAGRFVITVVEEGRLQIYTIRPDGSGLTRVAYNQQAQNTYPSFSFDGKKIVYKRWNNMNPSPEVDIVLHNLDSGSEEVLYSSTESDLSGFLFPIMLPDESGVLFSADEQSGFTNIYRVNRSDRSLQKIVDGAAVGGNVVINSISPDGSKMLYTYTPHSLNGLSEVYLSNINGAARENLTQTTNIAEGRGEISPDGNYIVYESSESAAGSTSILYKMDLRDRLVLDISKRSDVVDHSPSFSPDGEWIVFSRYGELTIMRNNGSELRPVKNVTNLGKLGTHIWGE